MKRLLIGISIVAEAGASLHRLPAAEPSPAAPVVAGRIIEGPALESSAGNSAIIRWTANSAKGTFLRYGVVHYGVAPEHLSQTAKSPNRWNPSAPTMTYRVRLGGLQPGTTYYYAVGMMSAIDARDEPTEVVGSFATPSAP